ncbi:MAG: dihydroneopterin aldolase, partial [Caulobacterales bacterium]|nr:dihydroneopterin aldolase [Caulobacterales bacterium]
EKPQDLIINVTIHLDFFASKDEIDNVLDYDFIINAIRDMAKNGHINLQETLCENILQICLSKPNVIGAEVSTEKPNIYSDAESVGCKMSLFK